MIPVFKAQSAQGTIIAEGIPPRGTPKSINLGIELFDLSRRVFEGSIVGEI